MKGSIQGARKGGGRTGRIADTWACPPCKAAHSTAEQCTCGTAADSYGNRLRAEQDEYGAWNAEREEEAEAAIAQLHFEVMKWKTTVPRKQDAMTRAEP